ncbi:hypothetical protein LJC20_02750 [Eubacteriales bacterium OttesenSCG-928-M02]|nr:hypothetical protein [Eubacteriales bacterium OttesenSCG-928-M02]
MEQYESRKREKRGAPRSKITQTRMKGDWHYFLLCLLSAMIFFLTVDEKSTEFEILSLVAVMAVSGLYGLYLRLYYLRWELWVYDDVFVERMILGWHRNHLLSRLERFRVRENVKGTPFGKNTTEYLYDLVLHFPNGQLSIPVEAKGSSILINRLLSYFEERNPEVAEAMEREMDYYGIS